MFALINAFNGLKRLSIWLDDKSVIVATQFRLFCTAISSQSELIHLDLIYFSPIHHRIAGIHGMLASTIARLQRFTIGCVFKQISEILPAISSNRLEHLSLMLDRTQLKNWLTDGQHWNIFDKVSQLKVLHLNIVNVDVRKTRYCSFLVHFPKLEVFRLKVQCLGKGKSHNMVSKICQLNQPINSYLLAYLEWSLLSSPMWRYPRQCTSTEAVDTDGLCRQLHLPSVGVGDGQPSPGVNSPTTTLRVLWAPSQHFWRWSTRTGVSHPRHSRSDNGRTLSQCRPVHLCWSCPSNSGHTGTATFQWTALSIKTNGSTETTGGAVFLFSL